MPSQSNEVMSSVLLGVTAFTAFMPPLTKVRRATEADTDVAADLRTAEYAATVIAVMAGGIIAILTKDYQPLYLSVLTVVSMIFLYETVYRTEYAV